MDEGLASSRGEFFRAPMMNDGWSHETDSRVPVFVVVVAEEVTAEQVSILDGTETLRCFGHQVLLRRQGHFYNRGRRPTCAGERHRVGLY